MLTFLVFIFGLIVGSFLNALIFRLGTPKSVLFGRSECPECHHKLLWPDLIPLLSFIFLRGHCRYCQRSISWQYPMVELVTAVVFVAIFNFSAFSAGRQFTHLIGGQAIFNLEFFFKLIFVCFLIVIFVYDLKHYLILDKVVLPASGLAVFYDLLASRFWDGFFGALLLSGFFAFLFLVSKGKWIGLGDVKLGLFLGFLVPFPETLVLFFLAYFLGALVSVVLLSLKGMKLTDRLPFGVFLTSAAFVAMLWGEEMARWYLRMTGLG